MATWREMCLENRDAAQVLLETGLLRPSVSRAYYAAYCAVTSELDGKVTFSHEGNNPSHVDLPNLILHNISVLPLDRRRRVKSIVERLWKLRVAAEYVPYTQIDRRVAVNALRDANIVLVLLEVPE